MGIRSERIRRGITQVELAKFIGVGQSTVAMWETGNSIPRGKTLIKLAEVLECSIEKLLSSESFENEAVKGELS